jgi:hypothetical protein
MGCKHSGPIIQINVVETKQKLFFTREEWQTYKTFHQLLVTKKIVFPTSGYRILAGNNIIDPYTPVKIHKDIKIQIFTENAYSSYLSLQMLTLYRI